MSRGPGKVQTAIKAALAKQPAKGFRVSELAAIAYPGVVIERSHEVAVRRALKSFNLYREMFGEHGRQAGPRLSVRLQKPARPGK